MNVSKITLMFVLKAVNKAMKLHTESSPGHILIFLTGQDEIERCCDQLFEKAENLDYRYDVQNRHVSAMLVLPLYGSMSTGNYSSQTHCILRSLPILTGDMF